jgi:Ca-activated chloride channel homolog
MTFLRPEFLNLGWALLALTVWLIFSLGRLHRARRQLGGALQSLVSRPSSLSRRALQMALGLAALACLILALARPQSVFQRRVVQLRQMDAVILLDVSPSMRAQDIQPSRLARATGVIARFLQKKLPGDRVGLVAFAGNSLALSYLTGDPKNLLFYLDYVRGQSALQYGTNIGGALKSGMVMMTRQGEIEAGARKNKKVFILLSDGEDHGEELKAEEREIVERGIPVYCVGVGSRDGALIPVGEQNGRMRYLTASDGEPIRTTFNDSTLQDVAERSGGRYYRVQTGPEMTQAFDDIFLKAREVQGYRLVTESKELYMELLAAAFALFLIRMVI